MKKGFTILVADLNGNVREFLKREFINEGYNVVLAKDGREILSLVDSIDPPDLLIMDLLMPFVDGMVVLERLQKREQYLPVVVFTSLTEYQNAPAVKKADAFIEKEGDLSQLKKKVGELLNKFYPRESAPLKIEKGL